MALTKVTLIQDGVITAGHLHANHGITTDTIGEGANKFYTDARVAQYLSANNYQTSAAGYFTGVTHDTVGQTLTFSKSNATTEVVSLAQYIDDTNLARLTSGTVDAATGIATFTRDDATTFTVDFSSLLDDTNDYVSSASFNTADGVLTLTRFGGSTVTVDLDGRYLTSETDSQTLSWADATNTLSISNGNSIVITGFADASHTHDDRYYTETESDARYQPIGSYAASSHTHSYLPLSGGTLTGTVTLGELLIGEHPVHAGYWGLRNSQASATDTQQYLIISSGTDTYVNGDQVYIRAGNNSTSNELKVTTGGVTIGGDAVIHAGNIGSQSVSYASTAGDANTLDGYDSGTLWRRTGATNGVAGGGWMTVAYYGSGRGSGEVIVTDGESSDHSFIRIHWMRSYADSNFTVLNCGGHANRITGARVLYQTSDNTYGGKYLQVYVTTSSNYYVRITKEGDTPHYGSLTAIAPVIENTKTGYAVHGNELTGLDNTSLAAEEGIKAGGNIYTNSYGSADQWNTAYGWGNHASAGYQPAGSYAPAGGSYGTDWYANALYYDDWVRNHSNNNGIYWSTTNWHLYPINTSDFRVRSGDNGGAALRFYTGNTDRNYVYCNSSNEIGFLSSGRSWMFRVDNSGHSTATGSLRAPIFYDSNNTGYYADMAGVTTLKHLRVMGNWSDYGAPYDGQITIRGNYPSIQFRSVNADKMWLRHMDGAGEIQHYFANGVDSTAWSIKHTMYQTGSFRSVGDHRAPIFYDLDNTGTYVNPNGASNLDNAGNTDLYLGGVDSDRTYNGDAHRDGLTINGGAYPHIDVNGRGGTNTTHGPVISMTSDLTAGGFRRWGMGIASTNPNELSFGYYDNQPNPHYGIGINWGSPAKMWIDTGGNLFSTGSMRSPIFYDYNNTGYYVNPDGTSNMWDVQVNGTVRFMNYGLGVTGTYTSTRLQTIFNMDDQYSISADGSATNNAYGLYWSHPNAGGLGGANNLASHGIIILEAGGYKGSWGGGRLVTTADIRGTVFYDYNNTGYYVDPASATRLNGLLVDTIDCYTAGYFYSNLGGYSGSLSSPGMQVYSTANNSAFMSFHKSGNYAVNMGLDADNVLRIGGWSASANRWELDMAGNNWVAGSSRAPIFYDKDNTAYYCDPNGVSRQGRITLVYNQDNGTPRWDFKAYVVESQHHYAHNSTQTMYIGESNPVNVPGDIRVPIYYDYNNTGYYVDPASLSNMYNVTLNGPDFYSTNVKNFYLTGSAEDGGWGSYISYRSAVGGGTNRFQLGAYNNLFLTRYNFGAGTKVIEKNSETYKVWDYSTTNNSQILSSRYTMKNLSSNVPNLCLSSTYYASQDFISFHNATSGYEIGHISFTGTTTIGLTTSQSDLRLKTNISDWTDNVSDDFETLQPKTFDYIYSAETDSLQKGFIAQNEVDKFPEAYPIGKDGYYGFNPTGMVPYLMKALQEQIKKNKDLEQRLTDIEQRLTNAGL